MPHNRICIPLLIGILLLNADFVSAQTDSSGTGRFDAGGQFTLRVLGFSYTIDQNVCGFNSILLHTCVPNLVTSNKHDTTLGFGGRLGYALSKRVTVDGALNYFPFDTEYRRLPKGIQGLV